LFLYRPGSRAISPSDELHHIIELIHNQDITRNPSLGDKLRYKEFHCSVSHEKFGFYIHIYSQLQLSETEKIFNEICMVLEKTLELSEDIVKEVALSKINSGNVIIHNNFPDLEDRSLFFREASKNVMQQDISNNKYLSKKQSRYHEEAAYVAFYSLIEHLCSLVLAFTNSDMRTELLSFTKLKWYEKYKIVFPLSTPEFKEFYDYFHELSKFRRNPTAHGFVDPLHTVFSFYYEPAKHRIPVSVYDGKIINKWYDGDKNLEKLDAFLKRIHIIENTGFHHAHKDVCNFSSRLIFEKISIFPI